MDHINFLREKTSRKQGEYKDVNLIAQGRKYIPKAIDTSNKLKFKITSRLFWGRSNLYKNISHFLMILISSIFLLGGFLNRVASSNTANSLEEQKIVTGTTDYLFQGASTQTIAISELGITGLQTFKHVVQPGENLETIAEKYNSISVDTIRWANKDKLDFSSFLTNNVPVGIELTIPSINGVLYTVKQGQTIEDIIRLTSLNNDEANIFNIQEFNNLRPPYTLQEGQVLFIPEGNLRDNEFGEVHDIPRGIFINPLSDPSCAGYSFSRGFLWYHNGLDLARWPGCPIQAVANGTVIYAGWSSAGEGYNVRIDHGGGIVTHYYHGNGEFYVKAGDRVKQGQPIMFMGTSGNSTGVHLHFTIFYKGRAIDPSPYVPY